MTYGLVWLVVVIGLVPSCMGQRKDPKYSDSWHLHRVHSLGSLEVDLAWKQGITGAGRTIGFSGEFPIFDHPELVDRLNTTINRETPSKTSRFATATIATAVGNAHNGECTRGVAYGAQYGVYPEDPTLNFLLTSALTDVVVINDAGLEQAVKCSTCWDNIASVSSRTVVVVSAGSGGEEGNCNLDQHTNAPLSISVGAHDNFGAPTDYTETCSNTLVSAPGGTSDTGIWVSTAIDACQMGFGSQFPTAEAAGVIAMIQQASRSTLTTRHIAHLLVMSATSSVDGNTANGARREWHPRMGFGMINGSKAVDLAKEETVTHYTFLNPSKRDVQIAKVDVPASGSLVLKTIPPHDSHTSVDWVSVHINFDHMYCSDLSVTLTSPSGTAHKLLSSRPSASSAKKTMGVETEGITPLSLSVHAINNAALNTAGRTSVVFYTVAPGASCCSSINCKLTLLSGSSGFFGVAYVLVLPDEVDCKTSQQIHYILHPTKNTYQFPTIVVLQSTPNDPYLFETHVPVFSVSSPMDFMSLEFLPASETHLITFADPKTPLSLPHWSFTSTKFWGEDIAGNWTITITDEVLGDTGAVSFVKITYFPYRLLPPSPSPSPTPFVPAPSFSPSPSPSPTPYDLTDPQLEMSWHLHNNFIGGMNADLSWSLGSTGKGKSIGYSFIKPYASNPELLEREKPAGNHAHVFIDDDYQMSMKTSVISAAVGNFLNHFCSNGIAYDAKYNVIGGLEESKNMKFLTFLDTQVNVFVVDYSGTNTPGERAHCTTCWENVKDTVDRGIPVVTVSGGSGPNSDCNFDMYTNAPFAISVGSHGQDGFASEYSAPCIAALVSAPGEDIIAGYGSSGCQAEGTSAHSASLVGATVALMLDANANLNPREIAHILVESATPSVTDRKLNGAGLMYNPKLGFGYVDAGKAVKMASGLLPWQKFQPGTASVTKGGGLRIKDLTIASVPVVIQSPATTVVDWVSVHMDIKHSYVSDLRIQLTSPSGTRSTFLEPQHLEPDMTKMLFTASTVPPTLIEMATLNDVASAYIQDGLLPYEVENPIFYVVTYTCCSSHSCRLSLKVDDAPPGFTYILLLDDESCTAETQVNSVMKNFKSQYKLPDIIIVGGGSRATFPFTNPKVHHPVVFGAPTNLVKNAINKFVDHNPPKIVLSSVFLKVESHLTDWGFSSTRHWMEPAAGLWSLAINDEVLKDEGIVNSYTITINTIDLW